MVGGLRCQGCEDAPIGQHTGPHDWGDPLDIPENHAHIEGCTCDHDPGDHDWGQCGVAGCQCEGGWTE